MHRRQLILSGLAATGAAGLNACASAGQPADPNYPIRSDQTAQAYSADELVAAGSRELGIAAEAMGADLAYIGSAFIATDEARASEAYKQCIVSSGSEDIVYSATFTGVHGNYLKPSIVAAGLDPDKTSVADPSKMDFGTTGNAAKAWKDIWGCGQGIAPIKQVQPAAKYIEQLAREYAAARARVAV